VHTAPSQHCRTRWTNQWSDVALSIALKNVTKRFGDTVAVDNLSFAVNEGELVALLGPSGGGKTTVLRLIAGLEAPSSGEIFIRGHCVNDLPVQDRNIGFVFQSYALFKSMNVFNNIAFGLRVRKWKKSAIESRVNELMHLFGLEDLGHRYPHQLSGGQRQRVAIARALAPKPDVLLLDEPFGAVDARIRQELRQWLVRLHHQFKVTTLFVTHDQEEAMEVASRIGILNRGRLEQVGSPQEVYEQPANEFVARFIGAMNVLELEVHGGVARHGEIIFPVPEHSDGAKVRVGFRPYSVQISTCIGEYPYRAVIKHVYFLGIMMRLDLELASGLTICTRLTKEEYKRLGLAPGIQVSFRIAEFRVLGVESNMNQRFEGRDSIEC
ncbi:MAG: ABC transporter ATP-binding protein, partial [Verrucomicrobiae bacterium]|nr:ABC transporter ATP-binding protein [Verrucomicrobiae bacterium]